MNDCVLSGVLEWLSGELCGSALAYAVERVTYDFGSGFGWRCGRYEFVVVCYVDSGLFRCRCTGSVLGNYVGWYNFNCDLSDPSLCELVLDFAVESIERMKRE